jgi:hypothetical protein
MRRSRGERQAASSPTTPAGVTSPHAQIAAACGALPWHERTRTRIAAPSAPPHPPSAPASPRSPDPHRRAHPHRRTAGPAVRTRIAAPAARTRRPRARRRTRRPHTRRPHPHCRARRPHPHCRARPRGTRCPAPPAVPPDAPVAPHPNRLPPSPAPPGRRLRYAYQITHMSVRHCHSRNLHPRGPHARQLHGQWPAHHRRRAPGQAAALGVAGRAWSHGHEVRLRHCAVRRVPRCTATAPLCMRASRRSALSRALRSRRSRVFRPMARTGCSAHGRNSTWRRRQGRAR